MRHLRRSFVASGEEEKVPRRNRRCLRLSLSRRRSQRVSAREGREGCGGASASRASTIASLDRCHIRGRGRVARHHQDLESVAYDSGVVRLLRSMGMSIAPLSLCISDHREGRVKQTRRRAVRYCRRERSGKNPSVGTTLRL